MAKRFRWAVFLSGVSLCCLLQPIRGHGQQLVVRACAALQETEPARQVSVYVAKAAAKPGFICARIINGIGEPIYSGVPMGQLQQWEEGWWWREGQFEDYQPDGALPRLSALYSLGPGQRRDENHPSSPQPAPPGRYRVCARYKVGRLGEGSEHETCSAEFVLP